MLVAIYPQLGKLPEFGKPRDIITRDYQLFTIFKELEIVVLVTLHCGMDKHTFRLS
jgi:hypothetical protein